jgi:Rrf2 family transcriptional repressor of oqxAB
MKPIGRAVTAGPGWFAVAVHALAFLARSDGVCPSTMLAGSVNSHAVFMRRVLAQLVRARIVEAREGRDGGYRLARSPDRITLADVFRAVKPAGTLAPASLDAQPECDGSGSLHAALDEIANETESRVLEVLERHTIAGVLARAETLAAQSSAGPLTSQALRD